MKRSTKKVLAAMVAILIVLVIIIVILAVTDKPVKTAEELGETVIGEQAAAALDTTPTEPETEEPAEPTSVDLPNEKEIRLYVGGGGTMEAVTAYNSTWSPDEDIATFEAINSDEDTIYYDNYYLLHETYWESVNTATKYKIGYELNFDVNGEHKQITILKPGDITGNPDLFMGDADNDEVTGYLGVWVYNDIGQTGVYVHLTQAEMTEDTLMTSIKLRPTPQSDQISNLKLKAFSYSSDEEFNSKGIYIGTHGYEIAINND